METHDAEQSLSGPAARLGQLNQSDTQVFVMSDGANDAASALRQLALGQQPITKREECQPTNGAPEDAAAFADRDDLTHGHVAQRLRPA